VTNLALNRDRQAHKDEVEERYFNVFMDDYLEWSLLARKKLPNGPLE
jgi:hypothetical protein